MATTSLWAVRGTIRDVVAYVKDPNKTANPDYDLKNVLTYAVDNDKTEKQYYGSDHAVFWNHRQNLPQCL